MVEYKFQVLFASTTRFNQKEPLIVFLRLKHFRRVDQNGTYHIIKNGNPLPNRVPSEKIRHSLVTIKLRFSTSEE